MSYYKIINDFRGEAQPVSCQYYIIQDGWVVFCVDEYEAQRIILAIPSSGFWFTEINKDEFDELVRQIESENEEEFEDYEDEGAEDGDILR